MSPRNARVEIMRFNVEYFDNEFTDELGPNDFNANVYNTSRYKNYSFRTQNGGHGPSNGPIYGQQIWLTWYE